MSVKVPYDQLSSEALEGLITQFVSRDGSDSGNVDAAFERKVESVKSQLKSGNALILYDPKTQSFNIVSKNDPVIKDLSL
ncbi:MAG: YheU family protein [Desulfobacteraceae bacterium]|nr:YheU family protein [Desulfobacteraceae bacterium]